MNESSVERGISNDNVYIPQDSINLNFESIINDTNHFSKNLEISHYLDFSEISKSVNKIENHSDSLQLIDHDHSQFQNISKIQKPKKSLINKKLPFENPSSLDSSELHDSSLHSRSIFKQTLSELQCESRLPKPKKESKNQIDQTFETQDLSASRSPKCTERKELTINTSKSANNDPKFQNISSFSKSKSKEKIKNRNEKLQNLSTASKPKKNGKKNPIPIDSQEPINESRLQDVSYLSKSREISFNEQSSFGLSDISYVSKVNKNKKLIIDIPKSLNEFELQGSLLNPIQNSSSVSDLQDQCTNLTPRKNNKKKKSFDDVQHPNNDRSLFLKSKIVRFNDQIDKSQISESSILINDISTTSKPRKISKKKKSTVDILHSLSGSESPQDSCLSKSRNRSKNHDDNSTISKRVKSKKKIYSNDTSQSSDFHNISDISRTKRVKKIDSNESFDIYALKSEVLKPRKNSKKKKNLQIDIPKALVLTYLEDKVKRQISNVSNISAQLNIENSINEEQLSISSSSQNENKSELYKSIKHKLSLKKLVGKIRRKERLSIIQEFKGADLEEEDNQNEEKNRQDIIIDDNNEDVNLSRDSSFHRRELKEREKVNDSKQKSMKSIQFADNI